MTFDGLKMDAMATGYINPHVLLDLVEQLRDEYEMEDYEFECADNASHWLQELINANPGVY